MNRRNANASPRSRFRTSTFFIESFSALYCFEAHVIFCIIVNVNGELVNAVVGAAGVANDFVNRFPDAPDDVILTRFENEFVILAVVSRIRAVVYAEPAHVPNDFNVGGTGRASAVYAEQVVAAIFIGPLIVSNDGDVLTARDVAGSFMFLPHFIGADDHANARVFVEFRDDLLHSERLETIVGVKLDVVFAFGNGDTHIQAQADIIDVEDNEFDGRGIGSIFVATLEIAAHFVCRRVFGSAVDDDNCLDVLDRLILHAFDGGTDELGAIIYRDYDTGNTIGELLCFIGRVFNLAVVSIGSQVGADAFQVFGQGALLARR
jgi:hypothetical protein